MKPMLELKDVSKSFAGLRVLNQVDLQVYPGEILGLIGPNGAGKTTLFNLITGVLRPDHGKILCSGTEIQAKLPSERASKFKMGRTFQVVRPFLGLTCEENIRVALATQDLAETEAKLRAEALLRRVGLLSKRAVESRHLPLMEKKKLELARALAIEPKILLLDEILSGLNPVEVSESLKWIRELNQEMKITIVWIEHLVRAVAGTAHRLAVLHQGVILKTGDAKSVLEDPEVVEAYLGASDE